ncbi:MAG: hypothetical protein V4634_04040 [Pseudomonadota bacterium]
MHNLRFAVAALCFLVAPDSSTAYDGMPVHSNSAPPVPQTNNVAGAETVDIDCDGKPDKVFLSQSKTSVAVRVEFGVSSKKAARFQFDVAAGRQSAVCTIPVHLEVESLDYDPTDAVGPLPGFKSSKTCKSVALVDDECDSIHFFWNHKTRHLQWWRS